MRSILFPKPMGFKFYQDAIKFICVLALVAALGMCYSIYILISKGVRIHAVSTYVSAAYAQHT